MSRTWLEEAVTIPDKKDGYWQIKLDKESAKVPLLHGEDNHFNRPLFSIQSENEVFQQKNYECFGVNQTIHIIADDMIFVAADKEEHDTILKHVLQRAWQKSIKLNKNMILFLVKDIKYTGHMFSKNGIRPDDD